MKSLEQMGGPPEQPNEEPAKNKKEASGKPVSPESCKEAGLNEADWEKAEGRRKRKEEEMEDEERELNATISKDATFADLFNAIDAIEEEEGLGELHFEEELWDNFDAEIMEEVLAFQDIQANKAATTKVLDFFRERGYSQDDVSIFLPIKFKRERKKK